MIAPRCLRESARLPQLLAGQLSAAVADDVTRHVEQCAECRQHLERLAAGPEWWAEARQYLLDGETDEGGQTAESSGVESADGALSLRQLVTGFLEPAVDERQLGRLDGYDILDVIGCGGMGIVLKGHERDLNRLVAIKMLAPHFATNAAARKRFAREAQAAAAVVHPHVLAIHSVCAAGRIPYLVMPLVSGPSLQQRIDQQGPLEIRDILRIGMQAAQGLAAAHAQGLVHRDVKPANIMLENGVERVLLTDFGLARAVDDVSLTHSGVIAGTPQFMSPEQARGDSVDHRTDLFSLGSVLYTMCAGRPPFRAESTMGLLRRICEDSPRRLREINPDVPGWLAAVVDRLLAKSPADRFQSAEEVARLLERYLAHLQHPTAMPLPDEAAEAPSRSQYGKMIFSRKVLAVTAMALAVVAAAIWMPGLVATHDQLPAEESSVIEQDRMPVAPPRSRQGGPPTNADTEVEGTLWHDAMEQTLYDIDQRLRQLDASGDF